jgi:hypothetical protein
VAESPFELSQMPHSKTLPLSDQRGSILWELHYGGFRHNSWLAARAGYEDGRYPHGPQWGTPAGRSSKVGREYRKGHRKGAKAHRLFINAAPSELDEARMWLRSVLDKGEVDEGEVVDSRSDDDVFDAIHAHYMGGWKQFLADTENIRIRRRLGTEAEGAAS